MTGSAVITLLLLLLLFLIVMPGTKKQEDEGIMVSFGNADDGAGMEETPANQPTQEAYTPPAAAPTPVKQNYITQDDQSLAIAEQKKKQKQEQQALEQQRLAQQKADAEQKKKQQDAINNANALNGLFGKGGSAGSGTTSGNTQQGNPAGHGSSGGNSWSLNGRSTQGLVEPNEIYQEGRVVVSITVDASGRVIGAKATGGNVSDQATKKLCEDAAKKTKFTPGNSEVRGTITYNLSFD